MTSAANWGVHRFGDAPSVVLHVPHAGFRVPPEVRRGIVLDDAELETELARMTDRHTDHVALAACERAEVSAVVVVNQLSRLVVDPERFPDDEEPMADVGMGRVYLRTSSLGVLREPDHRRDAALVDGYFSPYERAVADVVDEVLAERGGVTIVDLHSYPSVALPYERDPAADRPGVCLGTDAVHTPPELLDAAVAAFDGSPGGVGCDTPFAGTYVPRHRHGHDPAVRSLMVELRRDLYMDEATLALHDGAPEVTDRLASLLVHVAR